MEFDVRRLGYFAIPDVPMFFVVNQGWRSMTVPGEGSFQISLWVSISGKRSFPDSTLGASVRLATNFVA